MTININGTTGISGVDGSAGTPAIQGSDTNTGINFGTNEVSVSTDGSTRLTIDSSGRLLQNLTSAPGFIGGVSHQIIQGEGTLNSNGTLALLRNAVPTAGQGVGQIFMGDNGGQRGVVIQGQAVSNWGTGDCPTDLVISTSADASATPTERVHIKSTGEVRIGLDSNAASTAGDDLVIQGTSDRGLSIVSGTSSSSNIFFGDSDDTDVGRIAYQHNDNALDFSTNGGGTDLRIDSSGRLLIATNSSVSSNALFSVRTGAGGSGCIAEIRHAGNSGANRDFIRFYNIDDVEAGSIEHDGSTSVAFRTASDYRLKENIVPLTGALQRLSLLKPSRFNFISQPERVVDGFIAHEAQEVIPESVGGEKDAVDENGNPIYQGIDQSKMVPLLTAALQEAIAKIETLEARLTVLEGGAN